VGKCPGPKTNLKETLLGRRAKENG